MLAKFAVSVAVGFVGAYPLALASGLFTYLRAQNRDPDLVLVFASGFILFALTLTLITPALQLISTIIATLRNVEERPKPWLACVFLLLGTALSLSAMTVVYNATRPIPQIPQGFTLNSNGFNASNPIDLQPPSSLGLTLITFLTFFLGTVLVSLGIWATLTTGVNRRSLVGSTSLIKPSIPELDDVAV